MADLTKEEQETLEKSTTRGRSSLLWKNYYWYKEGCDRRAATIGLGPTPEEKAMLEDMKTWRKERTD